MRTAPLPLTLETGLDAPDQTVRMFVADDPARADGRLRIKLIGSVRQDAMTFSLNGEALPLETAARTTHGGGGNIYVWLEFPVPDGVLQEGDNEVGVALHARPENLVGKVIWEAAELLVAYPGPVANTPLDRLAAVNRA